MEIGPSTLPGPPKCRLLWLLLSLSTRGTGNAGSYTWPGNGNYNVGYNVGVQSCVGLGNSNDAAIHARLEVAVVTVEAWHL